MVPHLHFSSRAGWFVGFIQRAGLVRAFFLLVASWLTTTALWAQPASAEMPGDTGRVQVTSIQQFWDLSAEEKALPQKFSIDCTVTYFDPIWRILFVLDTEGRGAYVPYGDNPHPFKAGETITARGTFIPPSLDVSFEHATITPRSGPPIQPLPATADIVQYARFITKLVTVDGYVDNERRGDTGHLQLLLSVNGETVTAWVLMKPDVPTPDLTGRKIRVEGVYNSKVGPDGLLSSLEIMVPSLEQVTSLGRLADDSGFALPVSPINTLQHLPANQVVRVAGTVIEREPGRYIRIRDGSGQIDLMTGQMRPCAINDVVEAIGYPATSEPTWRLRNALFVIRTVPTTRPLLPGEKPGTARLAADVLKLSADEAAQGRPVLLTGVVTWSHPSSPFFFIHDSSGGVCIMRGKSESNVRSPGRNLEVHGVTAMGPFAPVVMASKFERVSDAILPVARQVSMEHALTGIEEAQWVEMRGYLRRIYREGNWNYLELATATTDFIAVLPVTEDVSAMIGSVIRLHGVCSADADAQHKLTGIKLWVPGISYVEVEEPAPPDLFSVPFRSLTSLGQFEAVQAFNRRLRVSGVVLHQSPGHSIHLEESGHSLLVLSRQTTPLRPGDRIEAVGFLGREIGRITLREAVYRVASPGLQPPPQKYDPEERPSVPLDGQLVSIEGVLLDSSVVGGLGQLTMQTPRAIFEAVLEGAPENFSDLPAGSRASLTGVYEVDYDEHGRPEAFKLRLRSTTDVTVLESPSWWTRTRILAFTGVLALGALLFLGWITVLRRQVQQQTSLIRTQMERSTRLQEELARAGKLESLGLLAGGIAHDFNNLLTVLMGNISLIRLDERLGDESMKCLAQSEKAAIRARDLTQQLLTFAKGGAPLRAAVSLPEVVREVSEFALRGSKVRCQFNVVDGLWPASVDKGQIGQVVQNIVINALQAMPEGGVVEISLSNQAVGSDLGAVLAPGQYVRVDIRDHGPGIAAADLSRIFDPYFTTKKHGSGLGLATVHSIVKKHSGHITAESTLGVGTTFRIWLPAAEPDVAMAADSPAPASTPLSVTTARARVLFMDDEEFIRNLGSSILRRYGYQATAVNDGAAALAEYTRAKAAGEPYDLVILDLTIPGGMGGKQTMEELLKLDPAVKAIVSSGYSNDLVLSNYQSHGFRGMVSKPYDVADFAHAVERVLKGERA